MISSETLAERFANISENIFNNFNVVFLLEKLTYHFKYFVLISILCFLCNFLHNTRNITNSRSGWN